MFSDYLYTIINKNVINTTLFNAKQKQDAREFIRSREPITENTIETIIARFLFAKTLKKLLEDPDSELSQKILNQKKLRETLHKVYIHAITRVNDWYGYQFAVSMPGPFVVPDITPIAGKKVADIASGTYGEVYKTDKDMAVKRMREYDLDASTLREVSILHYLDHPNVISFKAIQLNPPKIAMPLAAGTLEILNLTTIVNRKWVFYQLFRGLAYIHSKHIWHLDLKPANVLFFKDSNIVKLADFGLALPYAHQEKNNLNVVTLWWRAPEILLGDEKYGAAVDVWSLGVMLLEGIADLQIFPGDTEKDTIKYIFGQLGAPTDKDWPEVRQLSLWEERTRLSAAPAPTLKIKRDQANKVWVIEGTNFVVKNLKDNTIIGKLSNGKTVALSVAERETLQSTGLKMKEPKDILNFSRRLSVNRIPGTTNTAFDPQEYKVIESTVTWPNERLTALEVLNLPYFDSVRDTIEIQIPSYPITVESCGDLMIKDQRQYTLQDELTEKNRRNAFIWIWRIFKKLKFKMQTLFYAIELFDIIIIKKNFAGKKGSDILKIAYRYLIAALYISAEMYEAQVPYPGDYVYMSNTVISDEIELQEIVREILTIIDFELVFPTCDDFIIEYMGDEKDHYDEITQVAYLLYLNYKYATQYTASQLAQIAIEVAKDVQPKCLTDKPKLYDASIAKYLIDIWKAYKKDFQKYGFKEPRIIAEKKEKAAEEKQHDLKFRQMMETMQRHSDDSQRLIDDLQRLRARYQRLTKSQRQGAKPQYLIAESQRMKTQQKQLSAESQRLKTQQKQLDAEVAELQRRGQREEKSAPASSSPTVQ